MKLREKKCHCGWPYLTFHVCLGLDERSMQRVEVKTPSEIARAEEASERKKRNALIVEKYKTGEFSIAMLAERFRMSGSSISKILRQHQREDGTPLTRGRGERVVRRGARSFHE